MGRKDLDVARDSTVAKEATPLLSPPSTALAATGAHNVNRSVGTLVPGLNYATTTSTTFADVVNITGAGVVQFAACQNNSAGGSNQGVMEVIIDGVTTGVSTGSGQHSLGCPVGAMLQVETASFSLCLDAIPFKTSLQIRHRSTVAGQQTTTYARYRRTA